MAIEIERKYLVHKPLWETLPKDKASYFRQGYLVSDPDKTIRIRVTDATAYLTLKGASQRDGFARPEFEYEIPKQEGLELLDLFASSEVEKYRYYIPFGKHLWEVDVFLGDNEGLIIAEIELSAEDESFALPAWIGKEVTHEARYANAVLAQKPYKTWF